jgi:hypothetical protein
MGALSKIKQAGFDVALVDGFIEITPASELTQSQLAFLKSHKAEIINELQPDALAVIEAHDNQTFVSCGKCLGFKSHNAHGKGAGYCLIGGDYGLWSETQHQCTKFDACVVIQDYVVTVGAATVTCYSPNGQAFELEARDPEHAAWLQRMNPKPKI